jgi:hypothetical protein
MTDKQFTPLVIETPEEIGDKVARLFNWDGVAITRAFMAALTDANFHQLRARLEPIINHHLGEQPAPINAIFTGSPKALAALNQALNYNKE